MSDSDLFFCHTLEEHAQVLADFLPNGDFYAAKNISDSLYRKFLRGLAYVPQTQEEFLKLFDQSIDISHTVAFLEGWELTLGIPDDCFTVEGKTNEERRQQILFKLASLGVSTEEDFVELAAVYGVTIEISQGILSAQFPYTFPIVFFDTDKRARFTMVITFFAEEPTTFPLTFPILFGDATIGVLECLFRKLVPANVDLKFIRSSDEPPPPVDQGGFSAGFDEPAFG